MKKFQFRLERLQKLRERVREQRKVALAEAVNYLQRVEDQIGQLESLRGEEQNAQRALLLEGPVSIESVIRGQSFDGLLGRFAQQLGNQLEQVERVVEQRRLQVREAEKSVRILEKLEAKQHTRYDETANAADRQLLDELAAVADQRRRLGLAGDL